MPDVETIVYTNEPGKVMPILQAELEDFGTEATAFLNGQREELKFIPFRLKQGVYGQRQPGVQMIRTKLPFGGVTPDQMDTLAYVAETYAPLRKGHITTRQNIQFHHVPLARAKEVLDVLGRAGLTSREACGNTVRNVTGDPWAGVLDELFDPTPYAGALCRYFLRNPLSQALPRKFKVCFTADDTDRAITGINDLGFIPRIQDGVKGFRVITGGGLSILPRAGYVLYEFVSLDEYLKVAEAIVRVFEKCDELRKNRAKARLKFFVDRIGIDAFREVVDEELRGDWTTNRDFRPDRLLYMDDEEGTLQPRKPHYEQPNGDMRAFSAFVTANVRAQRQQGFSTVEVKITRGDLKPEQWRGLAQLLRDYASGRARTTIGQNVVIRWVRDESLYEVWKGLRELGLADLGPQTINDVVSCPGTDSCKMGITSSMGLNAAIQAKVESLNIQDPLTRKIHINMSGCPNSCGQHHIGSIGFHGAVIKVDGHQLPAYHVFVGGRYDQGDLRIATQLKVRMPAKRAPETVERFVALYEAERHPNEPFEAFFDRVGTKPFEDAVADLALPGEFDDENRTMFIDWGKLELYQMQRGEGECAI